MSALYQTNKLKKLDETKGVTRCRESKTDRQYNGEKDKRTNNDLQNTKQKT
jgi:uncharacterized protein YlbG (UPF0298 family)